MQWKRFIQLSLLALVALSVVILFQKSVVNAQSQPVRWLEQSPLPTPSPSLLSHEATIALQFVSKENEIPLEQLEFGSQQSVSFPTLGRSYSYVTVHHTRSDSFQMFGLLVDPATGEVADYNEVRAAEEAAYRARHGKMEPALQERLARMDDKERVPVAVWVGHTAQEHPVADIVAEVVARYPAAGEALARRGILQAVDDPALSAQIQTAYEQLLAENTEKRIRPIADWMQAQGYTVEIFSGMPALAATLPKAAILALAERGDVTQLYLTEAEASPALDIAVATDRVPPVWSQGYTGNGSRIAILERYNINATASACLTVAATRSSTADPIGHKSRVAAIAACNDSSLRGIAYGAQILDAGHNSTQSDVVEALKWATDPARPPAQVVNESESFEADQNLHFTDHAYDYWVRQRSFIAVIAAGNTSGNVTSPAKAYNVIAVGNVDDKNSAVWSDDEMRSTSAFNNPTTGVEKPEIASSGTNINTIAGQDTGTSFAAPQVAGLAALLMQRDTDLRLLPSAVKAILMASAVHNIEGNRYLSAKDGAGAIDAVLADQIARTEGSSGACNAPCWWNIPTTDFYPGLGVSVERTFNASRGERIRVTIAWLSLADPPNETSPDELYRNFDLQVIAPGGQTEKSESLYNNFEIVEFVAPTSGQYTIRATRSPSGDRGNEVINNQLGIAWSKQATYLPDVRRDSSGWESTLTIRNDGAEPRDVTVTFVFENGNFAASRSYAAENSGNLLQPNAVWSTSLPTSFSSFQGSAIVDGSEDLSVVVENIYDSGGRYLAAAYPGETTPATAVYAPFFLKKWPTLHSTWRQSSELRIHNPGSQQATVTVTIYDSWGADSGSASQSYTVPAGGQRLVPATDFTQVWDYGGFLAAARVSADQPVAVVVNTLTGLADGNGSITTPYLAGSYRAESRPANFLYATTTGREYNGYDSSLQVQNAGGSNTTFRLKYYPLNSGTPTLTLDKTVGPYRSANFWRPAGMPPGFFGSATVEVVSGGPLAAMAQYDRFDVANSRYGVTQYEGVSALNSSLGMAHIQKTSPWTYTGIQAQNMNSSPVSVQLHYFNPNGSSAGTSATKPNVPVNAAVNFWWTTGSPPEIPGGLNGSGVGGAANLALLVSFDRSGDPTYQNKDGMMGYAAVK